MDVKFSSITCIADMNITEAMDQCLTELSLPEVFVQSAKQMSLIDHKGFLGLRPSTRLQENRAVIYRMCVPQEFGTGIIRRISEATDLKMGGRGGIFTRHISLRRGTPLVFDNEKLEKLCGISNKIPPEDHALVCCTVPRGGGDSLAKAVLELGVCVPVIFFGTGVGLRDKLGLMRITIPIEKEIIWFIVPRSEAELVEKNIIPRARLDIPGKGFLYKSYVHAPVVNLRVRQGKRLHAASMEQVIAALDEIRGSSDWRRLGSKLIESIKSRTKTFSTKGLFFIGDEDEVELLRITAMENGARGATLNSVEMRSYSDHSSSQAMVSHSRQLCDIIVSRDVEEKLKEPFSQTGLFEDGKTGILKVFDVEMPFILRHLDTYNTQTH